MPGYTDHIDLDQSDDGNQTFGVMIHKESLFGGEPVSLLSWISMCYTLIQRGELKRLIRYRELLRDVIQKVS
jgi:hypothetical protein